MLLFNFARLSSPVTFTDFNTSHVVIQLYPNALIANQAYFNTSHVIIQPKPSSYININLNNFNTSHVVIQR